MPTLAWLVWLVTMHAAQAQRKQHSLEWDFRSEAEKVNARGCANLTLVLDNWKYAIMTQVKDLLLHDHSTVLPDYARIGPLSDALGDLYKEFNMLKERLGELTAKFDGVEAFVDDVRAGRSPAPPRGEPRPPAGRPAKRERHGNRGGKQQTSRTKNSSRGSKNKEACWFLSSSYLVEVEKN
ncbi:hypothetical protein N1851_017559 [Merluccius polli]|uniref:Uncharacterized protein n=1 Tax=Merluccius polli TaxID=89951 RepID=A0AA47P0N3_MERPO|nr:hypothetical protein N1851_017559 [Merluccius polli]